MTASSTDSCAGADELYFTDKCPDGQFGTNAKQDCRPCPAGGVCPGGYRLWPQNGYYKESKEEATYTNYLVKCETASRCMGGKDYGCAEGYSGLGCTACADNFYESDGV